MLAFSTTCITLILYLSKATFKSISYPHFCLIFVQAWVETELKSRSGNFILIALVSFSDITLTISNSLNKRKRVFGAHGETVFAGLFISRSIFVT